MKPTRNIARSLKPFWGKSPARSGTASQLFKDSDRDGVMNVFDCKPFNKRHQDNNEYIGGIPKKQFKKQPSDIRFEALREQERKEADERDDD